MYLNVIQLAESLGVEERVIENWVRTEGLPHVADRGRMVFDRAQVVQWAESHGLAAKVGFLAPERSQTQGGLEALLRVSGIWRDVVAADVPRVLGEIVARLPGATPAIRQLLQQRLRAAGGISWAPVGGGFALPHLRTPIALGRDAGIFAIVLLRDALAIDEPAPDEQPITRLLFFIAPSPRAHLDLLARLSTTLSRGRLRQAINDGVPDGEILAAITAVENPAKKEGPA